MIVPSLFGNLASRQNMQAVIDGSVNELYTQSDWRQYLDWGIPQVQLTFEAAIGRTRLQAAASIVDPDAPAPLRSRGKLELLTGKIPAMKEKFYLNQTDYRALKQLESLPISDGERKAQLIKVLRNDLTAAVTSTDKRLDFMFWQAVSTFSIDVSTINNPDGVAYGVVDLLASAYQTRFASTVWTDAAADPFKDIQNVVAFAATRGRSFSEILIDQTLWLSIKNLNAVKSAISGYQNPGSNKNFVVTDAIINEFLVANKMPPIRTINKRINIEKDGQEQLLNPFKAENIAFMPTGKIGTVQNALAMEDMEPVEGINYAKYDKTLLSKWRDNDPWREYTQVELNAFPTLDGIEGIYLMKTDATS